MGNQTAPNTLAPYHNEKPLIKRHSRFFSDRGSWYFRTREGYDIGPYESVDEAQLAVEYFIANISWPDHDELQAYKLHNERTSNTKH